jgi:hypothetical protein
MQFVVVHLAAVSPLDRAPRIAPRHCGGSSRVRRGRRFWRAIYKSFAVRRLARSIVIGFWEAMSNDEIRKTAEDDCPNGGGLVP